MVLYVWVCARKIEKCTYIELFVCECIYRVGFMCGYACIYVYVLLHVNCSCVLVSLVSILIYGSVRSWTSVRSWDLCVGFMWKFLRICMVVHVSVSRISKCAYINLLVLSCICLSICLSIFLIVGMHCNTVDISVNRSEPTLFMFTQISLILVHWKEWLFAAHAMNYGY